MVKIFFFEIHRAPSEIPKIREQQIMHRFCGLKTLVCKIYNKLKLEPFGVFSATIEISCRLPVRRKETIIWSGKYHCTR